jgi:uncharacterized protein
MNQTSPHFLRSVRILAGLAGTAALGAAGVVAAAATYATLMLNKRTPTVLSDNYTFSPFETNIANYEEISFTTADGLQLRGWWMPYPGAPATIVGFSGHRNAGADLLGIGSGLWRAGYNVLLFDWRSRGKSPIAQHSLAYYELQDAEAAINYAEQRAPQLPIGVVSFSMGAAIAILLAAREPRIRAIWADSPFTSIRDVVGAGVERLGLPAQPIVPVADAITHWRYGYRFDAIRPIDVVHQIAPRPLMLLHGTADSVIPVAHSERIHRAAGNNSQLVIFPEREHCEAYFLDRPGYVARAVAFFAQHLGSL